MNRQKGEHTARPLTRVSERLRLATSHNPERDNGYAVTPDSRECGCPPWVERCAHFEGRWIAIHEHPDGCSGLVICRGSDPPVFDTDATAHAGDSVCFEWDLSPAAALAAFERAEEELLRGAS